MRTRILTASAALTTAVVVAVITAGGTEAAATKVVKIDDYRFSPTSITIKPNTTVKWVWVGKADHNVEMLKAPKGTSRSLSTFDSDVMRKGSTTRTFKKSGTYRIDCSLHASIMKMTVKVK